MHGKFSPFHWPRKFFFLQKRLKHIHFLNFLTALETTTHSIKIDYNGIIQLADCTCLP